MTNRDAKVLELLRKDTLSDEEKHYLAHVTELDLPFMFTGVTDLPPLVSLVNLQMVDLSYTGVADLSPLEGLASLRELRLIGTGVADLSPLAGLANLRSLDLSGTGVADLSPLAGLANLRSLDLTGTGVADLSPLAGLANLRSLVLGGTNVTDLSPLAGLANLQGLSLSGTGVADLSPLEGLTGLESLFLLGCAVADLSPLASLAALQTLDLSETAVTDLTPLASLAALQTLDLSETAVTDLTPLVGLSGLKLIGLSGLHLDTFPRALVELELPFVFESDSLDFIIRGDAINLYDTTFRLMPASLFHQSHEFICAYYDQEFVRPREAKVILIGDGHRGKTYAMERLLNGGKKGDYPTKETHGINICDYRVPEDDVTIRLWDFGGQQVMHSMHTCFLTDRTGYVVFLSSRETDNAESGERWIKAIRSFAPRSRILVFVNLWDDDTYQGLAADLQWKYDGVEVRYCSVAYASEEEFNRTFRDGLVELARSLDSLDIELPASWNGVREEVRAMGRAEEDPDYTIEQDEYMGICHLHSIEDESLAGWLLEWMRDLGDCFFYEGDGLSGRQVLEPRWLTKAIYTIICYGQRHAGEDGIITRSVIRDILSDRDSYQSLIYRDVDDPDLSVAPDYSKEQVDYILGVMEQFLLSYKVDDNKEFIPSITSEEGGDLAPGSYKASRSFRLEYEYLPDTLVQRLMVKVMREGKRPDRVFRRGFRLRLPDVGTTVSVDARSADSVEVTLYKTDDKWAPPFAWQWVRKLILELGKDMNIEPTDEIVIVEYETDKTHQQKRREVSIDDLYEFLREGAQDYPVPGKTFDIHDLLCDTYGLEAANTTMREVAKGAGKPEFKELLGTDRTVNYIKQVTINNVNVYNYLRDNPKEALSHVVDQAEDLSPEQVEAVAEVLQDSNSNELQARGGELMAVKDDKEKAAGVLKLIGDALKNVNEGFKVGENIAKYGPTLFPLLQGLWHLVT